MRRESDGEHEGCRSLRAALRSGRDRIPVWIAAAGLLVVATWLAPRTITLHAAPRETPGAPGAVVPKVTVRTLSTEPARTTGAKKAARKAAPETPARRSRRDRPVAPRPEEPRAERARQLRRVETPRVASSERQEPAPRRPRSEARGASDTRGLSAETLNARAYRLQKRGRHREAERLLREALRKNPNYAYAQYNLGWSLVKQGRGKEAVLYLKRTSRAQPRRWEPVDKLADAYDQMGDRKEAARLREKARELRGGRADAGSEAKSGDRAEATPVVETKTAVSTAAWQQSTDSREETWFREKREGLPLVRVE